MALTRVFFSSPEQDVGLMDRRPLNCPGVHVHGALSVWKGRRRGDLGSERDDSCCREVRRGSRSPRTCGVEKGVGTAGRLPLLQVFGSLWMTGERWWSFNSLLAADSDTLSSHIWIGGTWQRSCNSSMGAVQKAPAISRRALFWVTSRDFISPVTLLPFRYHRGEPYVMMGRAHVL